MQKFLKRLFAFVLLIGFLIPYLSQHHVEAKGSATRYTTTLKSDTGKTYNIKLVGINNKTGVASYDSNTFYVWAGANPGDRIYKGNFQFYINGKKGNYSLKNYTYNKTQKMIYKISSKYKGQPDLLVVAETEGTDRQLADIYYMYNGKLKKIKGIEYTYKLKNIGKNKFKKATYYNGDNFGFEVKYVELNAKKGTLRLYKKTFVRGMNMKW